MTRRPDWTAVAETGWLVARGVECCYHTRLTFCVDFVFCVLFGGMSGSSVDDDGLRFASCCVGASSVDGMLWRSCLTMYVTEERTYQGRCGGDGGKHSAGGWFLRG